MKMITGEKTVTQGIYGGFGRFVRWLFRTFSPRYRVVGELPREGVVYVCRHLNMHGPYTTIKWLPMELHPMVLHVFFERSTTVSHMTAYTFGTRYGKEGKRFSLLAWCLGWILPPLMASLQAIPVYRDGMKTITTMKKGLQYLLKQESLIVYPDVGYTDGYDKPGEIYNGFLYIGELYYKRTGKPLQFVPLILDDENRRILVGTPLTITDFRAQKEEVAAKLKEAINP